MYPTIQVPSCTTAIASCSETVVSGEVECQLYERYMCVAGRYHIEVDLYGRSYEQGAPFYTKVITLPNNAVRTCVPYTSNAEPALKLLSCR